MRVYHYPVLIRTAALEEVLRVLRVSAEEGVLGAVQSEAALSVLQVAADDLVRLLSLPSD